ncbi:MAG: hypothetical protein GX767_07110, partial [Firmicutes bacterium]|nr:hypothetical protein [Bacillota bacterium]
MYRTALTSICVLSLCLLFSFLPQAAVAGGQNVVQEDVIPVVLDGLPLSFDVPPLIIEG